MRARSYGRTVRGESGRRGSPAVRGGSGKRGWPAATLAPAVLASLALVGCGGGEAPQPAGEDHTHVGGDVVTVWTDSLELFLEYPPQVAGRESEPWAVHLTWLADWRPVREGRLELRLRGPGGADERFVAEAPARPGIFTPAPTPTAAGTWRIDLTLSSRGREWEIPVGPMRVFESEDALPHGEEETAGDRIVFPKERQWEVPFGVERAEERQVPASLRAAGALEAPAGALARVGAPVAGIVVAGEAWPAPGERVRAGRTLAVLAPVGGEGSFAALRARTARLEREVRRAERLHAAEAIAEKRLVEARHELAVARAALRAVAGPEAAVEGAATEEVDPGAAAEDPAAAGDLDAYRYRLRSPIDGVVTERHLAPGQRVEAGAPAFTVVDTRRLWLRLHVPATGAFRAASATGATFRVEGDDRVHRAGRVVSVGAVIDPETRTLPVLLEVANPDGRLKVGLLAEGRLLLGDPVRGVAVPAEAVGEEDGLPVAYVEVGGETFERRALELGPGDGTWTIVRSGVSPGDRVVTRGAYQVHLASLGDAEPADHGHPH